MQKAKLQYVTFLNSKQNGLKVNTFTQEAQQTFHAGARLRIR